MFKKSKSSRKYKVSEYIKRSLSEIFHHHNFSDNNGNSFYLNISEVNISSDLKNAFVFVTHFSRNGFFISDEEIISIAKKDLHLIKKKLASNLSLRFTPKITLQVDELPNQTKKIEKLFKDPRVSQDL